MPKELDSCVKQVKKKKKKGNAYAICRAALGTDKQIRQRRGKRKQ